MGLKTLYVGILLVASVLTLVDLYLLAELYDKAIDGMVAHPDRATEIFEYFTGKASMKIGLTIWVWICVAVGAVMRLYRIEGQTQ